MQDGAETHPCSQVNHLSMTVSQCMIAWNFTAKESKDDTMMKRVVRLSKQIKAHSPPVALTCAAVPQVVSPPVKSRASVSGTDVSNLTNGSNERSDDKRTSTKRKRDTTVLPGQKRIRKTARQAQQDRANKAIHRQTKAKAFIKACILHC